MYVQCMHVYVTMKGPLLLSSFRLLLSFLFDVDGVFSLVYANCLGDIV